MSQSNPKLTSLYQFFLRATSASVLHNSLATRHLRRLYRPTFEATTKTVKKVENSIPEDSAHLKKWLAEFDYRSERRF